MFSPPAVPGPVIDLTAEVRLISIVLTWTAPQEPNGVIIAYEVTYTVNEVNITVANTSDISTTFTMELVPGTNISDISVRAYTVTGPGNSTEHEEDVLIPKQLVLRMSVPHSCIFTYLAPGHSREKEGGRGARGTLAQPHQIFGHSVQYPGKFLPPNFQKTCLHL